MALTNSSSKTGISIEFLDVKHRINVRNPKGFISKDNGRSFLNRKSIHPLYVFKSDINHKTN